MKAPNKLAPIVVRALAANEILARYSINLTGARVLLWVSANPAIVPRRPTLTRLAVELKMSSGGVHRGLAALEDRELPLIETERGPGGSRSGGISLTPEGQRVVTEYLKTLDKTEPKQTIKKATSGSIRQVSWIDDELVLELTPREAIEDDEIDVWMREFLSELPAMKKTRGGIALKFKNITDAVFFKLRWVG